MYKEGYCTTCGIGTGQGGVGISKMFKLFYVIGIALSGQISCTGLVASVLHGCQVLEERICSSTNKNFLKEELFSGNEANRKS